MADIAEDGVPYSTVSNGQDWRVTWSPPPDPPEGRPHGAEALCLTAEGRVVLVSMDGAGWGLPAGRPEPGETWLDTMRREVLEEACAEVTDARLLGFTRGVCVRGHEQGLVLVRSMWQASVRLHPWWPRFEMTRRRLLRPQAAYGAISTESGYAPFYRRFFREAGHG